VGGNLGTASPAGDGLPPLYASDAEVEVASVKSTRRVPVAEFIAGPKRNALKPDELISAFHIPEARGPQQYAKVGTRNAMVIAVCSFGLALHPGQRRVGTCVGSAAPTPVRAADAEAFIEGILEERELWGSRAQIGEAGLKRFGELVEPAARPISDVRGTAAYRRHAVGVLARRALKWAWDEYRAGD
jgi:CO/xanthine dehydrogenase FAD-binding subunit